MICLFFILHIVHIQIFPVVSKISFISRGRWAQMLAQGQSSSAKRGLAADVSSGLIFLKKKRSNFIAFLKKFWIQLRITHCIYFSPH